MKICQKWFDSLPRFVYQECFCSFVFLMHGTQEEEYLSSILKAQGFRLKSFLMPQLKNLSAVESYPTKLLCSSSV